MQKQEKGNLVVSRKVGEGIKIGEWEVVVKKVTEGKVYLYVHAPKDDFVLRTEHLTEPNYNY